MPDARLSDVLNNSLLHSLLPELKEEIGKISNDPSNLNAQFQAAYNSLKYRFAEFYEFRDPENFTWEQFYVLLSAFTPFDLQMALGPVLRAVMFDVMHANETEEDENTAEDILHYTKLSENGMYAALSPEELFVHLAYALGFSIIYHHDNRQIELPENERDKALFADRPCIHLYHRPDNNHYERAALDSDCIDFEKESLDDTNLLGIATIFRQQSAKHTQIGYELLKLYMRLLVNAANEHDQDAGEACETFYETVRQVEQYFSNAILDVSLTDDASHIIQSFSKTDLGAQNYEELPLSAIVQDLKEILAQTGDVTTPAPSQRVINIQTWVSSIQSPNVLSTIYGSDSSSNSLNMDSSPEHSFNIYDIHSSTHSKIFERKQLSPDDRFALSMNLFLNSDSDVEDNAKILHYKRRHNFTHINYCPTFSSGASTHSSFFWLRAMQFCLALGGVFALVALLTCAPVASGLGLTTVLGTAVADISVTATFLASTSVLLAGSLFAVHKISNEGTPPAAAPRLGG